jgi:hypothetical protein
MELITKAQREKHQDRFSLIQNFKNQQAREFTQEAMEKFKEDCEDISHRQNIRFEKEREHSHRNWQSWIRTQQDKGFTSTKLSANGSNMGSPTHTQRDKSPMGFG